MEKKGKVNEYYSNGELRFEGEYLNGKIYYNNGGITEIKNSNGKVKEYKYNGKLWFEGEYLNGERNGKRKKNNLFDYLKFEGEYLNGKKYKSKRILLK